MADTANSVIIGALRRIGVIPEYQQPDAYMVQRGLELMNDILDEWGASEIFIPYQTVLNVPLTYAKEVYTVGLSNSYDINSANVLEIMEGVIQDPAAPHVDYPTNMMTEQMYANIPYKAATGIPSRILLRTYNTYAEIRFQVLPYTNLNANLLVKQQLQRITNINQELSEIPAQYLLALKLRICVEAADMFGKTLSPDFLARTNNAINNLIASNTGIDWGVKRDEQLNVSNIVYYNWWI